MKYIKGLLLGIALAVPALPAHSSPAVGETPPDSLGFTPKGEEIRISDRRGKVVVVAFWASWCGYCRKQFPALEAIQQAAGRERLEVVLVNFQEPPRTYREIVRKLKKTTLTLTHDRDGTISDAYTVRAVPQLIMIDKAGRVGWTHSGYSEKSLPKIGDAVDRLLAEPWQAEEAAPVVASQGA